MDKSIFRLQTSGLSNLDYISNSCFTEEYPQTNYTQQPATIADRSSEELASEPNVEPNVHLLVCTTVKKNVNTDYLFIYFGTAREPTTLKECV